MTQAQSNPFLRSDSNKRYYTYDYYFNNDTAIEDARCRFLAFLSLIMK